MKLSIISFTENGKQLSERIVQQLGEATDIKVEATLFTKCEACKNDIHVTYIATSVAIWAGAQMREQNAILFIGACGIAVRAIAPSLTDKLHDAPVLVMDEAGRYVIPILSGHMGGANELAWYIAEQTGAEPVITTATDIRGKFAVDLFAKKNNLHIVNKEGIVKVSAKALAGKDITLSIAPEHVRRVETTGLPSGVRLVPYPPAGFADVVVTSDVGAYDAAIVLQPREYIIGMGCKKGKRAEEIGNFIVGKLEELGGSVAQILALASISQKRDEPGLVEWCRKEGIPFLTYTAKELQEVQGEFEESAFVQAQVGIGNVCERAAVKACGEGGRLIVAKYAENGMTIAIAKRC